MGTYGRVLFGQTDPSRLSELNIYGEVTFFKRTLIKIIHSLFPNVWMSIQPQGKFKKSLFIHRVFEQNSLLWISEQTSCSKDNEIIIKSSPGVCFTFFSISESRRHFPWIMIRFQFPKKQNKSKQTLWQDNCCHYFIRCVSDQLTPGKKNTIMAFLLTELLRRSGPRFHRPQSTTSSTVCKGGMLHRMRPRLAAFLSPQLPQKHADLHVKSII